MNAFRRKGRRFLETKLPHVVDGETTWLRFPCGTIDRATANDMDDMVEALASKHAYDVLAMVAAKPQRWTLPQLFAKWNAVSSTRTDRRQVPIPPSKDERIDALRAEIADVDIQPLVETFFKVMSGPSSGVSLDTAQHYRAAVRLFIPKGEPFVRSGLTERELRVWLEEMDDVAPATVRKRGQGMRRFVEWLRHREVLTSDPMRDIVLPPQGDPLCHYLETHEAERLADAMDGQDRLFAMVLPGSAIEVSVALALRVRDVMKEDREIRAAGTKSYNRDRIVRVADWAWPAVLELVKGKHPDSRLFDQIPDRWIAGDAHVAAVTALIAKGHAIYETPKRYTMRDHRHTWAVRAARSGWPIEGIARQLGHANGVLALKVYGRFCPTKAERNRWEALSVAMDKAHADERKKSNG